MPIVSTGKPPLPTRFDLAVASSAWINSKALSVDLLVTKIIPYNSYKYSNTLEIWH